MERRHGGNQTDLIDLLGRLFRHKCNKTAIFRAASAKMKWDGQIGRQREMI